jgi:antitoxin component YwqK of YwqJK toxin-antitoxin module
MRYITIALLLFCLLGCQEHKKVVSKYKNGNPEIVLHYDGSDTSTYKKEAFFESGKLEYVGNVVKGTKEGVWIWWYDNGKKKDQCKYLHGVDIDTIFHWYENGNFKRVDILLKGKIDSNASCSVCCNMRSKLYHENGRLEEELNVIDNMIEDTNRHWFDNGKLESISVRKHDILNGLVEQYYSNGQIKRHAIYKDDWEDGKVTEWDSTGKITYEKYWRDKKEVN